MSPQPFRDQPDHDLQRLSDDDLIDYIRAATEAGAHAASRRALAFLAFGYIEIVRLRVAMKVPTADVEDVAETAITSAIVSTFDGRSVGEFRAWMHRIVARRIADYHRAKEGKPSLVPLDADLDEESHGVEPAVEPEGEAIDLERAVDQAYTELSPEHRRVVDGYVFEDQAATTVAAALDGMSEANVHQIASRFRKRVRELIEEDDSG